jgi:crotonobetainyl-CoA:carnitine CoA-transferase CaiB-like acyl-CoA transferase
MKALSDIRVLELGQLLAGPFAGYTLAGFGAEVIKVEPPGSGDPLRGWRKLHEGTSLWWYSLGRNKKSITLDLRDKRAAPILKRLVAHCDVLIENFRPGRMEEWGFGYDELARENPGLVMVRISGWGQTGPYAQRPGFASVAEGIGGLRYIVGEPDRPPVRTGLSIGDSLAGLHAVIGTLTALHHRARTGKGQVVDTAIYESVFNMMESTLPEFDKQGHVRERSGARVPGIVPSNSYRCSDGKYVVIGGNNDSIFKRLMQAVERPDLASDPRLASNPGRVEHEQEIDAALEAFTSRHTFEQVNAALTKADVPAGPIYSIADIAQDPQFHARAMFDRVQLPDGEPLQVPAYVPKLSETPGQTEWAGPQLGEHNRAVYGELLGMADDELDALTAARVI